MYTATATTTTQHQNSFGRYQHTTNANGTTAVGSVTSNTNVPTYNTHYLNMRSANSAANKTTAIVITPVLKTEVPPTGIHIPLPPPKPSAAANSSAATTTVDADGNTITIPANDARHILAERFKTKECRHYITEGACPYEQRCMFAHGDDELRTAAMNIRDGLFTEDAIKAFKRAQRLAKRELQQQQAAEAQQRAAQQRAEAMAMMPPPPCYAEAVATTVAPQQHYEDQYFDTTALTTASPDSMNYNAPATPQHQHNHRSCSGAYCCSGNNSDNECCGNSCCTNNSCCGNGAAESGYYYCSGGEEDMTLEEQNNNFSHSIGNFPQQYDNSNSYQCSPADAAPPVYPFHQQGTIATVSPTSSTSSLNKRMVMKGAYAASRYRHNPYGPMVVAH